MKSKFYVTDAEQEVLEMLWKQEGPIKQSDLLKQFEAQEKGWKRQTLNTLIVRLEEKELVKRENRIVEPAYSKEEFHQLQLKEQIDSFYGGKWSNFFAAFSKHQKINSSEAEEIIRLVKDSSKED